MFNIKSLYLKVVLNSLVLAVCDKPATKCWLFSNTQGVHVQLKKNGTEASNITILPSALHKYV